MTTLLPLIVPALVLAGASAVNWAARPLASSETIPPAMPASPHH